MRVWAHQTSPSTTPCYPVHIQLHHKPSGSSKNVFRYKMSSRGKPLLVRIDQLRGSRTRPSRPPHASMGTLDVTQYHPRQPAHRNVHPTPVRFLKNVFRYKMSSRGKPPRLRIDQLQGSRTRPSRPPHASMGTPDVTQYHPVLPHSHTAPSQAVRFLKNRVPSQNERPRLQAFRGCRLTNSDGFEHDPRGRRMQVWDHWTSPSTTRGSRLT